ncbi:hypothetical protein Cni_G29105 [Canna indica]|uniref:Uncharacterized protein n=1 Tax=Canna indica TaxID=4628 RepID=A0AAQ3QPB9_9LILI|nr:hypothetical protein Cni_G29105 [Canna indica]
MLFTRSSGEHAQGYWWKCRGPGRSARGPEDQLGDAKPRRDVVRKGYQVVGDDARNARRGGGGVELHEQLRERGGAILLDGEP